MIANTARRNLFVENLYTFIRRYGFDGVLLDWQYPGSIGGDYDDYNNYVKLSERIRGRFAGTSYQLGITGPSKSGPIDGGYDILHITQCAIQYFYKKFDLSFMSFN